MPICSQFRFYIYYLGEFVKNTTHRFQCFSTNDVIIKSVYTDSEHMQKFKTFLFLFLFFFSFFFLYNPQDEASSGLKYTTREAFRHYGSSYIPRLGYRDMWAFVSQRIDGKFIAHAEGFEKSTGNFAWAGPVSIRTMVPIRRDSVKTECLWGDGEEARRRLDFCSKYEGYNKACSCEFFFALKKGPYASPIIPSAPKSSGCHFIFHRKCVSFE